MRRRLVFALLPVAVLLAAPGAGAQIPSLETIRATPLPGPAPVDVVRGAPLPAPVAGPALVLPAPGSAWDQLREAEEELRRREEDLARCRARIAQTTDELLRARAALDELEAASRRLRTDVLHRMRLLDRLGRGGLVRLVLTARDPGEARFRVNLLRRLVRADAALARRYAELRREAEDLRAGLDRRIRSQRTLEQQLEQRRRELDDEVHRHRALAALWHADPAVHGLEAGARGDLLALSAQRGIVPAAADPGRLHALALASCDLHPDLSVAADPLRGGVSLAVPPGTPVRAPAAATVVFAGPLGGFGTAVLLRTFDGEGILLGHLGALAVDYGAVVLPGEFVGVAAASPSPLFPGLLVDRVEGGRFAS